MFDLILDTTRYVGNLTVRSHQIKYFIIPKVKIGADFLRNPIKAKIQKKSKKKNSPNSKKLGQRF